MRTVSLVALTLLASGLLWTFRRKPRRETILGV